MSTSRRCNARPDTSTSAADDDGTDGSDLDMKNSTTGGERP